MTPETTETKTPWIFRIFLPPRSIVLTTLGVLGLVMAVVLQRGAPWLFNLHPLLMTLAYSVLMVLSIWYYIQPLVIKHALRKGFITTQEENNMDSEVESLTATATQALVKPFLPYSQMAFVLQPIPRETARHRHRIINLIVLGCSLVGLAAIMLNKLLRGKSVWPHTLHAWIGFLTIFATIAQALIGLQKYNALLDIDPQRIYKWHGQAGKVLFVCGNVSVVLGILDLWGFTVSSVLVSTCAAALPIAILYFIQLTNSER